MLHYPSIFISCILTVLLHLCCEYWHYYTSHTYYTSILRHLKYSSIFLYISQSVLSWAWMPLVQLLHHVGICSVQSDQTTIKLSPVVSTDNMRHGLYLSAITEITVSHYSANTPFPVTQNSILIQSGKNRLQIKFNCMLHTIFSQENIMHAILDIWLMVLAYVLVNITKLYTDVTAQIYQRFTDLLTGAWNGKLDSNVNRSSSRRSQTWWITVTQKFSRYIWHNSFKMIPNISFQHYFSDSAFSLCGCSILPV